MSTLKGIPAVIDGAAGDAAAGPANGVRSGQKYLTAQGFSAIKDGIKPHGDDHADGRGLHARLPLLRRRYR